MPNYSSSNLTNSEKVHRLDILCKLIFKRVGIPQEFTFSSRGSLEPSNERLLYALRWLR